MRNRIIMFIYLLIISFLWSTVCFAQLSDSGSKVVALGAINNNSSFGMSNIYLRADSSQAVDVEQSRENNVGAYRLYLRQGDQVPVTVDVFYESYNFSEQIIEKQCQIVVIAHDNGLVEMNVRQLPSFIHCAVDASNNIMLTDNFTKGRVGK